MTMVRLVGAAALSAIAMFIWGFVFWGPALNMMTRLTAPLPEAVELDVVAPLRAERIPSGMYIYPAPADPAHSQKMVEGPIFHMAYTSHGIQPFDVAIFAKGLLHSFVLALLAGVVARLALPALPTYRRRVLLLTLVGVIASLWTNVGNAIWYLFPTPYVLGQIAYGLVAGLLMALITAAIIRPETHPTQAR
jgi:hypothetical protein